MPEKVTNELIYEILKQMQGVLTDIKKTLGDHTHQFIAVRENINNIREDINSLRGDDLRRERIQAQMDVRLERIEARLNLNDTSH